MFKNYLKIILRNIKKRKLFAVTNVVGLALGLSCATLIFLWAKDEYSFDKFFPKGHRAYYVLTRENESDYGDSYINYPIAKKLKQNFAEVQAFTRYINQSQFSTTYFIYEPENKSTEKKCFYEYNFYVADSAFFTVFPFEFKYGSPKKVFSDLNSIVLEESIAQKYFGGANPVGEVLRCNDERDLTITGVVRIPEKSSIRFDLLGSIEIFRKSRLETWDVDGPGFISLNTNVDEPAFQKKIAGFLKEVSPNPDEKRMLHLLPISDSRLYWGNQVNLTVFSAVGVLILLIACFNFVNLSIASGLLRNKEIGIRKTNGAIRSQIIKQFILESASLVAVATIISLFLIELLTPGFNQLTFKKINFFQSDQIFFNMSLLLGLMFLTIAISGFYPAIYLSRFNPINALNASRSQEKEKSYFRKAIIIFQFTVSIFLICATIIISRQLNFISKVELGLSYDNIIRLPVSDSIRKSFSSWQTELEKNPNIRFVTAASTYPTAIYNNSDVTWQGREGKESAGFGFAMIQSEYVDTFGMEIVEGRNISPAVASDMNKYLITQKAKERMNLEGSPIGTKISLWGHKGEIVGVVKDFHSAELYQQIRPMILCPFPDYAFFLKHVFIKIQPGAYDAAIKHISAVHHQFSPDTPFDYELVDPKTGKIYGGEKHQALIYGISSLLAIFISCIGLFGLVTFRMQQKIKEIGIRKVLGASMEMLITMLSKEFAKWILIANLLAWPAAYFLMRYWLQRFAYRIEIGFGSFIIAGVATLAIALLTVSWQVLRTALTNPVEALRNE